MNEEKPPSSKKERKLQRKKMIANYKPTKEQIEKEQKLFDRLVIGKNEFYDVLDTIDAVLPSKNK